MIGILSVLLQQDSKNRKSITASYLADKFEVSRRTINRDIEELCMAGIPIQTVQGNGGGITIMDGFAMDRTLLTSRDMKMILAGLRSLDSVSGSKYYEQLMEKIKPGSSDMIAGSDSILIDLSAWSKAAIAPKISVVQDAIEQNKLLAFDYYSSSGDSKRKIEPYYLVFKWSSWYVYGFCRKRKDFRMFKLNRTGNIKCSKESFEAKKIPVPDFSVEKIYPANINFEIIVDSSERWRIIEEYGPDSLKKMENGKYFFSGFFSDYENLVSWLLTFGDKVKVVSPPELKQRLIDTANKICKLYKNKIAEGDR